MSTCISTHGEYSEHAPLDDDFCCSWCGAFNEDAAVDTRVAAERDALLAMFEALVEFWEQEWSPTDSGWVESCTRDLRNVIKEARA